MQCSLNSGQEEDFIEDFFTYNSKQKTNHLLHSNPDLISHLKKVEHPKDVFFPPAVAPTQLPGSQQRPSELSSKLKKGLQDSLQELEAERSEKDSLPPYILRKGLRMVKPYSHTMKTIVK
jgi:hypothetical protein